MMTQLFTSMCDAKMATCIEGARSRVAIACPALRGRAAAALISARDALGEESVAVVVDCDEDVFRLGYGDIAALDTLREAGVPVRHSPGLRVGVLVCDDRAWVFSPTALYVQDEVHSDETPNAVELRAADVERILWRIAPASANETPKHELPPELIEEQADCEIEVGVASVSDAAVNIAREALELAPPVPFDVARQVRVFEPYIQYVEISLKGAAIQRHRVEIPKSIQGLGAATEIEGRLRTTFELIEKNSKVSSKGLEDELAEIRSNFTRALGKPWGRVLLRAVRPTFDDRIEEFKKRLAEHRDKVREQLAADLATSRQNVIEYYLPHVKRSVPDALMGQILTQTPTDDDFKAWLDHELERVFPTPDDLIKDMRLELTFRDVTYETLNEDGFGEALRKVYPQVNWDKPFDEFNAAKERGS